MAHSKTHLGWIVFVATACSKSLLDISYFHRDGTFDSIVYGRTTFASHPVWCCVNLMLDAGAVLGALIAVREAIAVGRHRVGR